MAWFGPIFATVTLALVISLTGCRPAALPMAEHGVVLLRAGADGGWVVVPVDDALYQRFYDEVLTDPAVQRGMMLYDRATRAMVAANVTAPLPRAAAGYPVIILGGDRDAILRGVSARQGASELDIQLAMSLTVDETGDLALARDALPALAGMALLELVGVRPDAGEPPGLPRPDEVTTPSRALRAGFGLAMARERPAVTVDYSDTHTASDTPAAVAVFMARLLAEADDYYPQRHMLWFANFPADHVPYAKVLLAATRMPSRTTASLPLFAATYAETFPAERALVATLLDEALGAAGAR